MNNLKKFTTRRSKSNKLKMQKVLFQQRIFTVYSRENFEYITLYYFTCSMRCMFSKIKTNDWSVLLHFLVHEVRNWKQIKVPIYLQFAENT